MEVSKKGEVKRSRFYEGVMCSAARLTYNEAERVLSGKVKGKRARFKAQLDSLSGIYRVFARRRRGRGAIDFDIPQAKIEIDDRGRVRNVYAVRRLVTHQIIEECMIAANVEAAKYIRKARIPSLYRVHDGPDPDRVEELAIFLQGLGIGLSTPGESQPRDLSRVIEKAAGRPEEELIDTVILKCMSRAHYQPRNVGHFGLALPSYVHFTSPIRRYPDLLVHRAIKHLARHVKAKGFRYKLAHMEDLGQHCSRTERRADEAVWQVEERLKCAYLEQHIGDEFDVLVGINLLREGLDLPEVSLIVVIDADKEGFLRSKTSLLQVAGRAARNINGTVMLYADKITKSMQHLMDETKRRRKR